MQWIDVNKSKPEDNSAIIVLFDNGHISADIEFRKGYFYRKGGGGVTITPVTYWLPLPLKPKPKPDKRVATAVLRGRYDSFYCPQCEEGLVYCCCGRVCKEEFQYCPHCTQKLDWSEEA